MPHLEITEIVWVHCHTVNNNYQENPRVLYTFVPNKAFGQLLDTLPKKIMLLKTFNLEFSYIDVWFTDQNYKTLGK